MEKKIEPKNWLAERGYTVKQSATGYWRLFYGKYLAVDDPGNEDVYDEDSAATFFMDVAQSHEGPYSFNDVYGAVATYNVDPYCVEDDVDIHEWLWILNEDGGAHVTEHTQDNTDPEEWEDMCAKLDLTEANHARRILSADGGIICLNCDFKFSDE